jgi:hypothetical protein
MTKQRLLNKFLFSNGLSLLMFGLFAIFLIGGSMSGYLHNNQELQEHGQPAKTYGEYVVSGEFVEAVFENWESEFLQMAALVVATIFLRQKGAPDSKRLRGKEEVDTSSRYSIINAASGASRTKAVKEAIYANSLSLALLGLFLISFVLHAWGGVAAHNEEALTHGEETLGIMEYVRTSRFWFESFQNWQSEFLSVGALLLLSVYLRQRGSPESKAIGEPNSKTGS